MTEGIGAAATLGAAQQLFSRRWVPVMIPRGREASGFPGWQDLQLAKKEATLKHVRYQG